MEQITKHVHVIAIPAGFILVFPTRDALAGVIEHLQGMLEAKDAEVIPIGSLNYAAYLVATDTVLTTDEMDQTLDRICGVPRSPEEYAKEEESCEKP